MSDLFGRLAELMSETASNCLFYGIVSICTVITVVLLIRNRNQVKAFFTENRCDKKAMLGMVTSPGMLIFSVLMLLMGLLSITPIF